MTQTELLTEIDNFLLANPMAETTFGRLAVNDGKFVARLRGGKRCWPETAERVMDFIRSKSSTTEAA
jgi:hypothetical protein